MDFLTLSLKFVQQASSAQFKYCCIFKTLINTRLHVIPPFALMRVGTSGQLLNTRSTPSFLPGLSLNSYDLSKHQNRCRILDSSSQLYLYHSTKSLMVFCFHSSLGFWNHETKLLLVWPSNNNPIFHFNTKFVVCVMLHDYLSANFSCCIFKYPKI